MAVLKVAMTVVSCNLRKENWECKRGIECGAIYGYLAT